MKDLIGIKVKVIVDGIKVEGVVVGDRPDRVLIQTEEGKPAVRVPKGRISFFQPEREPEEQIPLMMLYCNRGKECPGVCFIYKGDKLTQKAFEVFMGPCPKRDANCRCGSFGDVRVVPQKRLAQVIGGLMVGDYPEEKSDGRKPE